MCLTPTTARNQLSMMKINLIEKGSDTPISKHLSQSELDCNCSDPFCNFTLFNQSVVDSFELTRVEFDSPIRITSFFRCQSHNFNVGGSENSNHMKGLAVDLKPINGNLDDLEKIARKYFKFVIRYKTFLHCDNLERG